MEHEYVKLDEATREARRSKGGRVVDAGPLHVKLEALAFDIQRAAIPKQALREFINVIKE